jgi:hypothetical protein
LAATLLGLCVWGVLHPTNAKGQAPAAQPTKGPEPVEVRFTDASSLRLTLREERVEVITRYGRLTIPIADVRRIEFATRLPDDVAQQVEAAVNSLGDPQAKVRDAASAELRKHRERAYPALLQAAKSTDPEVARRAEELLEWVRDNVAADQLEVRQQDVVQTDDMKVTGRIVGVVFKAHTSQFGDQALKLADLRSLRALNAADDAEPRNVIADPGTLMPYQNQIGKVLYIRVTGGAIGAPAGRIVGRGGPVAAPGGVPVPGGAPGMVMIAGGGGSVWGTDVYTADSALALAAVHAGAVQMGETAVVKVTMLPARANYVGSTRNGVTTQPYDQYPASFSVKRLAAPGD